MTRDLTLSLSWVQVCPRRHCSLGHSRAFRYGKRQNDQWSGFYIPHSLTRIWIPVTVSLPLLAHPSRMRAPSALQRHMIPRRAWLWVVVVVVLLLEEMGAAAAAATDSALTTTTTTTRRFARQGPVLTVRVPDPSSTAGAARSADATTGSNSNNILAALEPSVTYAIASQQPPLPHWLPALKSLSAGIGYQYQHFSSARPLQRVVHSRDQPESSNDAHQPTHRRRRRRRRWVTPAVPTALPLRPSWLETCAKWQFKALPNIVWQLQPRHDWSSTSANTEMATTSVVASATRGAQSLVTRWSRHHHQVDAAHHPRAESSSSSTTNPTSTAGGGWGLEAVRASLYWSLPLASLASIRITPQLSLNNERAKRGLLSCHVEAVTGGMGRTVATLALSTVKPTLSVQYQPDAYNWISPSIDLYTGHMQYQWIMALPNQSGSLHTTVDPATAITVTWTDHSRTGETSSGGSSSTGGGGGSTWVTDICIPLTGTSSLRNLAADIRVRRQFRF
jgi:hypothetical protein